MSTSNHIVPVRVYLSVFTALMVLLALTLFVAHFHWGPFNSVIAMTIAVTKAVIIILYFMHLRYSSKLTAIFVGGMFFWFSILIVISLSDYLARNWVEIPQPW